MTPEALEERLNDIDNALDRMQDEAAGFRQVIDKIEVIQNASPDHDKLFTALSKAQAEIENAQMDATNPHYGSQYASLDSCLNAVRPALTKHGLCLIQMPRYETTDKGTLIVLESVLGHTSGQSITNYFSMYPPKQDPQGIGSCLTYMRRYTVMAICGIAGAYDDDAEGAAAEKETISAAQADQIFNLADDLFGDDSEALLERMCDKIFGVEKVTDIPADEFEVALRRIENTRKRKDREAAEAQAADDAEPADDKEPEAPKKGDSKPSMSGK